ncbi:MAG: DUF2207 domain-containing protein [Coriobacteriales bacterium]|nr:DUF2207 domain-containing protein [Coriobacteriales bacterium]
MQVRSVRDCHVRAVCPLLFAVLLCAMAWLSIPSTASARSYKIGPISIDATVGSDGVIKVVDTRTITFDGRTDYIFWDFPMGDNKQGNYVIDGVSEVDGAGNETPLVPTEDEAAIKDRSARVANTYYVKYSETRRRGPDAKLYLFFDKQDTVATYRIRYRALDMVDAHADTGEMYWMYIAGNHNVVFRNVDVNITLPVPAGAQVITGGDGTNVHGWDQGGIYGSVWTDDAGVIHIERSKIAMGEYGEARATFPVEWLSGKTPSTVKHLDEILEEQDKWADETSQMRIKSDLRRKGAGITMYLIDAIVLAFALVAFFRWGRQYVPDYHERYCKEIPSRDHPVVMGEVWSWGQVDARCFVAGLMRLSQLGVVSLCQEDGTDEVRRDPGAGSCTLVLHPEAAAQMEDPIDVRAYALLARAAEGGDTCSPEQLRSWGEAHPEELEELLGDWRGSVKAISERRGFFESTGSSGRRVLLILGGALLIASLAIFLPFALGYESLYLEIATGVSILDAVIIMLFGLMMRRRSEEAADLQVRLLALERWLGDLSTEDGLPDGFSDEDWAGIVIAAEVFGIDTQVLGDLEARAPEALQGELASRARAWCVPTVDGPTSAELFAQAIEALGGVGDIGKGFGGGTSPVADMAVAAS